MRYLFDTDIVSHLMRPVPPVRLMDRVARLAVTDYCTSSVTLGELVFGARRHPGGAADLTRGIESVVRGMTVLPFDTRAATFYGSVRANLEARGLPIGHADTQIAAIALSRDLALVTGNVRHVKRVPDLLVENWL